MIDYKTKLKSVSICEEDLNNFAAINDAITDGIIPDIGEETDKLRRWLLDLIIERNRLCEEIDIVSDTMAISWKEIIE
jgi:hypothetical protein